VTLFTTVPAADFDSAPSSQSALFVSGIPK
jgi:hypothetical protein